jgi:uncharacterized protein YdbL (DUF1318 family)
MSILSAVVMLAVFAATPADAGSRELKSSGSVGETVDGYLGLVNDSASQDMRAEVNSINAARRAAYEEASGDTGRPLSEVQAVAGARLREKAQPGDWIQNAAGEWVQKQ